MAESFDPYHKWLGISPKDQPPNHYRLLAIELFESDPDVIEAAADQRMAHVRTYQTGQNSALSQQILNELSAAKLCLLNVQKKGDYDRQLREKLQQPKASVVSLASGEGPSGPPRSSTLARPLPQAWPLPTVQPSPIVVASPASSSIHRRGTGKKPAWRHPAFVACAGALMILLAVSIYVFGTGGPSPVGNRNDSRIQPSAPPVAVNPIPRSNADKKKPAEKQPANRQFAQSGTEQADFQIIEATWGTGDKWVNVSDGVRSQVKDNRLMMTVWSNMFGSPEDPAKGVGKVLRIRYRSRGKQYLVDYPDFYFVYLDGNPLAAPTDSPDGLELLEARYGAGVTYVDVLSQAREHVHDGRFSVPADLFAPATAEELAKENIHAGTFKVLWIRYRNGTGEHFTYAWNNHPVVIESRLPDAAGPPVDVLKRIDLKRDVVEGEWKLQDGLLDNPGTQDARLQFPVDPPDDYALTVVADREPEIMDISVLLPVGGKQVMSVVDGYGGVTTGLQVVNGGLADNNPSYRWRCARLFEQGRPNTLVYIVRRTSVRILRDGAEILRWSGDPGTFSLAESWQVPNPQRIALESYHTPYRVSKLELMPLVPDNSAMFVNLEQGRTVDLLKNVDRDRDLARGNWQYDGQSLISPSDRHGVIQAQLPAIVPANFQLDVVAKRETGDDCLSFSFPIAGTYGTLNIDGGKGTRSGLQMIDGKDFTANETTREVTIFADGKEHSINLRVQKNHVRAECDGQPIVDWTGNVSRLKPSEHVPYHDRIYVGNWYSRYRLTKIELTPLGAESERPSGLAGKPIDLLKQIDVKRDAVSGSWTMTDGVLKSPAAEEFACLALPYPPSKEYRLAVTVERLQGIDTFSVGLPIGEHQVVAAIDAWDGKFSGLETIDGKSCFENETAREGHVIESGQSYNLVYTVRNRAIKVETNGQTIIDWTGDPARLSSIPVFTAPDVNRLVLGTAHQSVFQISKVEIEPLIDAKSEIEKPTERKFSDLVTGTPSRAPVPDEAAQKQAKQALLKKLAAAKSAEQKRKLAQRFLEQASLAGSANAQVYALLSQAVDLAEACADLDLAWQAIGELDRVFTVDADDMRQTSLSQIAKGAKSPQSCRQLVDAACRLTASVLVDGKPDLVKKATAQAQSLAKRTKDKTLQKDVTVRTSGATKLAGEIESVAAARETLNTAPDDAHANFVVGHWQLCVEDDWEPALVKLAKGDDAGWKKLAAESRPLVHDLSDPNLQIATADAWWDEAEKEPWPGRHYLRLHAANWYRLALPSLLGEKRDHADERLKTLLASDEGLPAWDLFYGGQTAGDFCRITRGGSMMTYVSYNGPLDVTFIARTDSLNIRLVAFEHDAVIWNWELKPNELRVHRPDKSIATAAVEPLEPGRWYELHYRITRQGTEIAVDGVPVFAENRTYDKFPRAAVGVTGAGDAVIDVKKFVVKALE